MDRINEASSAHASSVSRSDQDLLDAARAGDSSAYDELWTWHSAAARRLASARVPAHAVDQVMDESYVRVRREIDIYGGPELAFRTYLLGAVRQVATDGRRAIATTPDSAKDIRRQQLALTAWKTLPEDSQALLWHMIVEGESAAQLASLLGTWPSDAASRGKLAKQAFRDAVIDESAAAATHSECVPVLDKLDSQLGRHNGTVRAHLRDCSDCRDAAAILASNKTAMRGFVAAALLGGSAVAARYLDGGAGRKGVLPGAKSALSGSGALHLARGVSRPGRAAGVGAVAAAGIAVAVAATAIATEAPDTPAQAAPRASAPGALPTGGLSTTSNTGSHAVLPRIVTAVQRGTTGHEASVSRSSRTGTPAPTSSTGSNTTAGTSSTGMVRPRTSSAAPTSTAPSSAPSSEPSGSGSPSSSPSSSPTSTPTSRPLSSAPVSGLTYTTSVTKTSVAAVWVTAGWEIVSLTDGSGTQHVTTPTGRYDGDVSPGTITVVVRATTPYLVGNLGSMFTNQQGLIVSGGMNHVLPPQPK